MPKIILPHQDNSFTLLLSQAEADNVFEISLRKKVTVLEVLEACFVIGSMKMTESLKSPDTPT